MVKWELHICWDVPINDYHHPKQRKKRKKKQKKKKSSRKKPTRTNQVLLLYLVTAVKKMHSLIWKTTDTLLFLIVTLVPLKKNVPLVYNVVKVFFFPVYLVV